MILIYYDLVDILIYIQFSPQSCLERALDK